jgi:hypothetical protein
MDDRLQEHLDHEANCYQNEFQAAFALSQRDREFDDRIHQAKEKGKSVVVFCFIEYCRFTDAMLGEGQKFNRAFDNKQEAEALAHELNEDIEPGDECGYKVI